MIMQQQGMNPMQYRMQMQQNMQNMQNGMAGKDLQRQAMQNNRWVQWSLVGTVTRTLTST